MEERREGSNTTSDLLKVTVNTPFKVMSVILAVMFGSYEVWVWLV